MMYKLFAIAMIALFPLLAAGQSSDLGNWLIYIGNKKIDARWNWHH